MRYFLVLFSVAHGAAIAAACGSSTNAVDSGIPDAMGGNDASGMKDRATIPSDGSGCAPKNLTGYQPPPFIPPLPQQNVCTPAQIQAFYDACVGPNADTTACQFWTAQNKKCEACVETGEGAMAWGALVYVANDYLPNRAGCIATLGHLECAKRASALWACTDAACHDDCPPAEDGGNTAYDACRTAAAGSVCKPYSDEVETVCPAPLGKADGSSIALCLQSDLQAFYMAFAPILCGAGG
jgi:hypothetical protein